MESLSGIFSLSLLISFLLPIISLFCPYHTAAESDLLLSIQFSLAHTNWVKEILTYDYLSLAACYQNYCWNCLPIFLEIC